MKDGIKKLKYAEGSVDYDNKRAVMLFYSDVDSWNVRDFMEEFKYLEDIGIRDVEVRINSTGGSVHEGMSVYNMILNSKMKITTINDSVAMSMGSIIWSAGDKLKMRDISILMIHKPFISGLDEENMDASTKAYISSMEHQLRMIYSKRFMFDNETVESIMSGKNGVDGTYFTASDAVSAGFLDSKNIIETPAIVKEEYANILSIENNYQYAKAVASIDFNKKIEEKQPITKNDTIINQTTTNTKNKMEEQMKLIASQLGIESGESNIKAINAKITALNKFEVENASLQAKIEKGNTEMEKLKASLSEKEAEILAAKSNVENLTANVDAVKEELKAYKEAEKAEKEAKIVALVDGAIKDGRIKEEAKDAFIEIAKSNYEKASELINGISPAPIKPLTEEISGEKDNLKDAQEITGDYLKKCNAENEKRLSQLRG